MGFVPRAVNDPVSWMHHANVDRLWAIWQVRHETELHHMPCEGAATGHNANDGMMPFGITPREATNMVSLGVEYDDAIGPCVDKGEFFTGQTYSQVLMGYYCQKSFLRQWRA